MIVYGVSTIIGNIENLNLDTCLCCYKMKIFCILLKLLPENSQFIWPKSYNFNKKKTQTLIFRLGELIKKKKVLVCSKNNILYNFFDLKRIDGSGIDNRMEIKLAILPYFQNVDYIASFIIKNNNWVQCNLYFKILFSIFLLFIHHSVLWIMSIENKKNVLL